MSTSPTRVPAGRPKAITKLSSSDSYEIVGNADSYDGTGRGSSTNTEKEKKQVSIHASQGLADKIRSDERRGCKANEVDK